MKPYWFGAIGLAVVLLFAGLAYADQTRLHWVAEGSRAVASPVALQDRVVGIEQHCQASELGDTSLLSPQHPVAAGVCYAVWDDVVAAQASATPTLHTWLYLEIIIRTPAGTIYRIDAPATTKVAVGDEWPPQ